MRWLIGALALLPLLAAAETAFVTDNLRLGLHRAEDTSDRAFQTLDSGQELEVLSRTRNYANVQLPDGTVGYVKAAYLVVDKPAKLIVGETQAANERLQAQLEALRQQFAGPAETIANLEQTNSDLQSQLATSQAQIDELAGQADALRQRQAQYRFSLPVTWVGGAIGVCLIGGFLLGLWWVDHRSRKRHGGIRIY
jgi:SH3 domain protein